MSISVQFYQLGAAASRFGDKWCDRDYKFSPSIHMVEHYAQLV
ncbi:hypothetical protein [Tolypothrix sp. FACHB-123]|nr:hypothetical protein [Tolypothrix sp. FACHB-123]